jgi:DNA polymerase-3 subunit epsilon
VKSSFDAGGCFPTGRHYPGIAHLLRISVDGLADEWGPEFDVRELPWVSIDTETTGRDPQEDRIIEIGCVFFQGGKVVGEKGWLIHPGRPIPEEASNVHGIFDADVAGKPRFEEVAEEILEALGGHLPLAYNADFDRKFIAEEFHRGCAWMSPGSILSTGRVNCTKSTRVELSVTCASAWVSRL